MTLQDVAKPHLFHQFQRIFRTPSKPEPTNISCLGVFGQVQRTFSPKQNWSPQKKHHLKAIALEKALKPLGTSENLMSKNLDKYPGNLANMDPRIMMMDLWKPRAHNLIWG